MFKDNLVPNEEDATRLAEILSVEDEQRRRTKLSRKESVLSALSGVSGEGSKSRIDTQEHRTLVDSDTTLSLNSTDADLNLDGDDSDGEVDQMGQYIGNPGLTSLSLGAFKLTLGVQASVSAFSASENITTPAYSTTHKPRTNPTVSLNKKVMAISVISISSDSSEDSVGTPAGRVILFGTIPTTIPDTTPVVTPPTTQTDTPSDPSEDPSSDHIPPLPATSPFLSSDDDPTDSDTPDTPSSPTHDTPFTEITASTQRSPTIPRRRVMLLASGQPIPHGRPYRYHLNGPVHMMTARKRVRPLPTHRLAERHPTDHSSSDSSSEASSDFHSDASSDPSSRHSLSDHSSPDLPGTSAGLSRKRRRSPMTSVPALSPVSGALSPVRADLIPSPKRVRDSGYSTEVEVDHRETSLRDDVIVRVSDEPHLEQDSDPEIQAEIDECFAYADALRDRGIDARVVVETIDRDETETGVRGPVEVRVERVTHPVMPEDIPEPAQEGAVEVTYETLGDLVQRFHDHTQAIPDHRIQTIEGVQREQGHRIVGVESAVMALTERLAELERDNRRLRGTMSVESQRVDRLQRGMSRMQRELRQIRRLRFYDRVRVGRLEACARKHMGYRS
ncbi:hypothetical protein Tco_1300493 [Tanacetum coccineum]